MVESRLASLREQARRALASDDTKALGLAIEQLEQEYLATSKWDSADSEHALQVLSALAEIMEASSDSKYFTDREVTVFDHTACIWIHLMNSRSTTHGETHSWTLEAGLRAVRALYIEDLSRQALSIARRCLDIAMSSRSEHEALVLEAMYRLGDCHSACGDVDRATALHENFQAALEDYLNRTTAPASESYDRWAGHLKGSRGFALRARLYDIAAREPARNVDDLDDPRVVRAIRHTLFLKDARQYRQAIDILLKCHSWGLEDRPESENSIPRALGDVVSAMMKDSGTFIDARSEPDASHPLNVGTLLREASALVSEIHKRARQAKQRARQEKLTEHEVLLQEYPSSDDDRASADAGPVSIWSGLRSQGLVARACGLLERAFGLCRGRDTHRELQTMCLDVLMELRSEPEKSLARRHIDLTLNEWLVAMYFERPSLTALPSGLTELMVQALAGHGHLDEAVSCADAFRTGTIELSNLGLETVSSLTFGSPPPSRSFVSISKYSWVPFLLTDERYKYRVDGALQAERLYERALRLRDGPQSQGVADSMYRIACLSVARALNTSHLSTYVDRVDDSNFESLVDATVLAYGEGSQRHAASILLVALHHALKLDTREPSEGSLDKTDSQDPLPYTDLLRMTRACLERQLETFGSSHHESLTAEFLHAIVLMDGGRLEQAAEIFGGLSERLGDVSAFERNLGYACRSSLMVIAAQRNLPHDVLLHADVLQRIIVAQLSEESFIDVPFLGEGNRLAFTRSARPPLVNDRLGELRYTRSFLCDALEALVSTQSIQYRSSCMDLLRVCVAQGYAHLSDIREDVVSGALHFVRSGGDLDGTRGLEVLRRALDQTLTVSRWHLEPMTRHWFPDPPPDEQIRWLIPAERANQVWSLHCEMLGARHAASLQCELRVTLLASLLETDEQVMMRLEELARRSLSILGPDDEVVLLALGELCRVLRDLRGSDDTTAVQHPDLYQLWWQRTPVFRRRAKWDPRVWGSSLATREFLPRHRHSSIDTDNTW